MNFANLSGYIESTGIAKAKLEKRANMNARLSKPTEITIYKVPKNYGLITWNGVYLTVS